MFRTKRQNKYGAVSQVYNGVRYHSKKEAAYAAELDLRVRSNDIQSWRRQIKVDLRVFNRHICNYYVDFEITHNDGSKELVEVKGFETAVWRLKWRLLEAIYGELHPEVELTVMK